MNPAAPANSDHPGLRRLPGRATAAGTAGYFARVAPGLPASAHRAFGDTRLTASVVGFGGYRIAQGHDPHAEALATALLGGVNLIDTSSNYSDGDSERLVGEALATMCWDGRLRREELIVVSKVGYVQGQNMAVVEAREEAGAPFPELVHYADGCWHCLHPEFLADQLERSLDRLRLETVDVYLLHNPEYFLSDWKKRGGGDLAAARAEYHRRLRAAFAWLETQVAAGRIGVYGVSSNTFPTPATAAEHTSLEAVLAMAREVGGEAHHCRVIQFPCNLYETGAVTVRNAADGTRSLAETAAAAGLATLVNRPLNAAQGRGGMVRLASFGVGAAAEAGAVAEAKALYTPLVGLLDRFENDTLPGLLGDSTDWDAADEQDARSLARVFQLVRQLADATAMFDSWMHWDHARRQAVEPTVAGALGRLDTRYRDRTDWLEFSFALRRASIDYLGAVETVYRARADRDAEAITDRLVALAPSLATTPGLAQQAVRVLVGITEFSTVLVGMRQAAYVTSILEAVAEPPPADAGRVLATWRSDS